MSDAEDASAASAELAEGIDEELDGDEAVGTAAKRSRWAGALDELARALAAMATEGGKSFIRYDESKETRHAKVQKERIVAVGKYLIQLRALHAGLNFKKSTLRKALTIVAKKMEPTWNLGHLHQRDWVDTMTSRISNVCAHTSACLRKDTAWAMRIFAGCTGDAEGGLSGAGAQAAVVRKPSALVERDWVYGWSQELNLAYRVRNPGTKERVNELSLPIKIESTARPTDCIVATWRDNSTYVVDEITVERFRKGGARKTHAKELEVYWEKEHSTTHNRIFISQRTDREQLLSLWEQEHQLAQVALWKFGPLPLPQPRPVPSDCPALVAAIKFLVPLGEAWANDEIKDKDELKQEKDARLKKLGIKGWGKVPQEYSTARLRAKTPTAATAKAASSSDTVEKAPTTIDFPDPLEARGVKTTSASPPSAAPPHMRRAWSTRTPPSTSRRLRTSWRRCRVRSGIAGECGGVMDVAVVVVVVVAVVVVAVHVVVATGDGGDGGGSVALLAEVMVVVAGDGAQCGAGRWRRW